MSQIKPPSSPPCWSIKYQDGDIECRQCKYSDTCRPAMINRVTQPETRPSLPVFRNYAPAPIPPPMAVRYPVQQTQAIIPPPPRPYYAPAVASLPPLPKPPTLPTPPTATTAAPSYYSSTSGYSLPNHQNPNPMASMHRPGAPAPAYYFTQYPGEAVSTRVVKNVILRALEAIFSELMQFFRHWTWPPRVA